MKHFPSANAKHLKSSAINKIKVQMIKLVNICGMTVKIILYIQILLINTKNINKQATGMDNL